VIFRKIEMTFSMKRIWSFSYVYGSFEIFDDKKIDFQRLFLYNVAPNLSQGFSKTFKSFRRPFIALQTKSFLFVAAHVKLRSSFSYVYGSFAIQAIVNLEFALLLQKWHRLTNEIFSVCSRPSKT
jgi:hypothetical protein